MPKKLFNNFASSSSIPSKCKLDSASNLHAFKASASNLPQEQSELEPKIAQVRTLCNNKGITPNAAGLYAQYDGMSSSRDNYTYDNISVSALAYSYIDQGIFSSLTNELDLAMAQSGLSQDFDSIKTQHTWHVSQQVVLKDTNTQAKDHLERIAQISGIPNYAQVSHLPEISLATTVHKPATLAHTEHNKDESLLFSEQELHANAYTKELIKLAQCDNLRQFTPQEQSTLINEYYSIFTRALNTIVLNSNNRFMVEQGLEHILLYAPQVFASEYRNFFNICLNVAPKALFWMLQYPFFANFFLLKPQSLSTYISKNQKLTTTLDEHIALEVSSTLQEYRELRRKFGEKSIPNINLQDNMLLSLYEEQILQRNLIEPSPKLTQRQRIRLQVQNNGIVPLDPAKQRLNLINHQIFALHNLKVRELRTMANSLESLAHNPNRLHKIFGSDLKSFHMNKQSLLQKMNSWTKIFPVEQQCLLVKMDQGFLLRSPQEPHKVYSINSFKETPLVILSGLEVCYQPEVNEPLKISPQTSTARPASSLNADSYAIASSASTSGSISDLKFETNSIKVADSRLDDAYDKDTAASTEISSTVKSAQKPKVKSKAKSQRTTKTIKHDVSGFDLSAIAHAGNSFKHLGSQVRQTKDALKAKLQDKTGMVFSDEMLGKAVLSKQDKSYTNELSLPLTQSRYQQSKPSAVHSKLQASDFIQDEYVENESNSDFTDSEIFKLDDALSEQQSLLTKDQDIQDQNNRPAAYLSGVFFGNQGESTISQLRHFNDRQLQVEDIQLGFMVVTL